MQERRRVAALPVHPVPPSLPGPDAWRLRVDGLVERPLELSAAEVGLLGAQAHSADFACEEGWVVPDQQWEGVALAAVLGRAGVRRDARFVRVHSGGYTVLLPLEEALLGGVLLAFRLNGAPLPAEHGAPLRLVAPGRACFFSVKWVDRIEALAAAAPVTGETIARSRLQRVSG